MNPHACRNSAIVLAGGSSSRMGRDKLALTINGSTLLERTVEIVAEVVDDVIVAGCPSWYGAPPSVRVVADAIGHHGPMGGLLAGLRATSQVHALVVAADLPFLQSTLLRFLLELAPGSDAVVPRVGGVPQTTLAVYAAGAADAIERRMIVGHRSLRSLLPLLRVRWVDEAELRDTDPQLESFINVNTPSQWRDATLKGSASLVYHTPSSATQREKSS